MLPALQVTVPSLVKAAPASQILSPPLMFNTPPVEMVNGPAKLPPLQVPTLFTSSTKPGPLPPSTPDVKLKAAVVSAELVKLAVPPLMMTFATLKPLLAP